MEKDSDEDKNKQLREPNSLIIPIALVATMVTTLGTAFYLVWAAAEFRTQVVTDMSWVKTSLATIVTRFNELDTLKARVDILNETGSKQMRETVSRLDRIEKSLEVHIETTKQGKP